LIPIVAADQLLKALARRDLAGRPAIERLGGILTLEYSENPGGFLSFGAGLPDTARWLVMVLFSGAIVVGALVYLLRARGLSRAQRIGLGLVVAGGLGNMIDRVFRDGYVVDYAMLSLGGPWHTGVFNLADVALMAGIGLFAIGSLLPGPQKSAETNPPL
jgi:signal peptidase II